MELQPIPGEMCPEGGGGAQKSYETWAAECNVPGYSPATGDPCTGALPVVQDPKESLEDIEVPDGLSWGGMDMNPLSRDQVRSGGSSLERRKLVGKSSTVQRWCQSISPFLGRAWWISAGSN